MSRYVSLGLYPFLVLASALTAYQTWKLARNFPSTAWMFKRRLMVAFMLLQVYGALNRWFLWTEFPVYLIGVLVLIVGMNWFDHLLLRDSRGIRAKAARLSLAPAVPVSGDLPPDFWQKEFRQAVRDTVKDDFLRPAV